MASQRLLLAPRNHFLLLIVTIAAVLASASGELHAAIESCSGWALNKLPNLKSFLKDGEAETYQNVKVTYIPGRKAVMTIYEGNSGDIYEDMEEKEKIVLSDYKTKEEMHALMVEKGFQLKPAEEIEAMMLQKQKENEEEAQRKAERKDATRIKREEAQKKRADAQKQKEEGDLADREMKKKEDVRGKVKEAFDQVGKKKKEEVEAMNKDEL